MIYDERLEKGVMIFLSWYLICDYVLKLNWVQNPIQETAGNI